MREEYEKAERKRKIAEIAGLEEIQKAIADSNAWREEFEKSFCGEGGGGVGVRPKPNYDFDALYKKYPVAKAYLEAKKYSDKTNLELSVE